jgi:glyoxylase-like metal-dependent hydrolase (beta-lactamase superfamily II)
MSVLEVNDHLLIQVRTPVLNFYILREGASLFLIDAGFIGGRGQLQRALNSSGWDKHRVVGIIVTHGHLDHILNIKALADEFDAWIAAPALDLSHYQGTPTYSGMATVTGMLEAVGKPMLGFQPFTPDRLLNDNDQIDIWGGLQAIHLPGHTEGHMGFYSPAKKLLFSGDLFASYRMWPHLPPNIFNSSPEDIPDSLQKASALDLEGVLPNHGDRAEPPEHLERLRKLLN